MTLQALQLLQGVATNCSGTRIIQTTKVYSVMERHAEGQGFKRVAPYQILRVQQKSDATPNP